jgi:tRNA U34 5-carboxymethylaminomethyl modifying GTPase MnmE/TrmE
MTSANTETIAAIATAPGAGGVGIVRLSGARARAIAEAITGTPLTPRHAHYARFAAANGEILDDGIALYFKSPASYTGEDIVELQSHGSPVVLEQLVQRCVELGARRARPGEFSERAFLNGKLDLAQAEAVADLIAAADANAARSKANSPAASKPSPRTCSRSACTSKRRSISPTNRSTRSAAHNYARVSPTRRNHWTDCCAPPNADAACAMACTR